MKILWIVNKIFPYPSQKIGIKQNVFGGWLESLANELKKQNNIELGIATTYKGNQIKKYNEQNISYYLIPGAPAMEYDKKMEKYWEKIKVDFKPEIVHLHGTEYAHGLSFLNRFPKIKNVVSIQGLVSVCAKVYLGNIETKDILRNETIRDIIKNDNIIKQKQKFEKRGKNEIEILKKTKAVIGRTTWDFSNVKAINPQIKYYKANEILRQEFYKEIWDINKIEKDTIFCSQAGYPIKGFHYLIEAVYLLKRNKPNIKLYVAGPNINTNNSIKAKIKTTGYAKYVKKLIKKYKLENEIIFTGLLNEKEMIQKLKKTNVFVLPSVIENSSNSLAEAMLLGMPCVASNTGRYNGYVRKPKGRIFISLYRTRNVCRIYRKIFK